MIIEQREKFLNSNPIRNEVTDANNNSNCHIGLRLSGNILTCSQRYVGLSRWSGGLSDRGIIKEFTPSSAGRLRRYLRECVADYSVFITLTYPSGNGFDGSRAKRDLSAFVKRYKRLAERSHQQKAFSAFWFMEFQERGSIHFHIFGTHFIDKWALSRAWYEVCGTEDIRHYQAGTSAEKIRGGRWGMVAYASKYAAKHVQKKPPSDFGWIGRFWGVYGLRITMAADIDIPVRDIGGVGLEETVKKIESVIEDAVFCEKARYFNTNHLGIYGLYIRDQGVIDKLKGLMAIYKLKYSDVVGRGMRLQLKQGGGEWL